MKRKNVSRITLTSLLIGILAFTVSIQPSSSRYNNFDQGGFDVNGSVERRWSFDTVREWGDFAYVDEDSAELVIGLSHAKLSAYAELSGLAAMDRGKIVKTVSSREAIWAVTVDIPLDSVASFTYKVKTAGLARYIEPNFKFQIQFVPHDPFWSQQWGPQKIEADWAWNTTVGNHSVLVAVIDTGVDYDHPDLAANYVALGYDWVNNDNYPMDDNGHGTHCAGIIAAVLNNAVGIAGIANVSIMAEKGLDAGGSGWDDDLANAIIHAVDQGADILSNSWGGYDDSYLIHDAVQYAYNHSVLVIAAAGNEATNLKLYPAAYDEVIAVTATDEYDNPAGFTNFGDWVELAAPGVDIYSTIWDNSYAYASGTSMATPHVSGVAALVWSRFPNMTRDQVRIQLRYTADDLGYPGFDVHYGYGRINARKAVEFTRPDHDLRLVKLEGPPYLEPGDRAVIDGTIFNFGASNESGITVQFLINGSLVDSVPISFLASLNSTTVSVAWSPLVEGTYNVTFYIVPVSGETIIENNVQSSTVLVLVVPEILVVADDDALWLNGTSLPHFESVLIAAGYNYLVWNESTMGRPSSEFLLKFGLVIWTSGDYYSGAVDSIDEVTLETYFARGGNILLEGEDIGYDHINDTFMINVAHAIYQVDKTDAPGLTVTDAAHPVTQGLPTNFTWLEDPLYDDGVTPTNGGFEVIRYTNTSWTAVTVFDGEGTSYGSVVYYAFPLYCLAETERNTLVANSLSWLLLHHNIAVADVKSSKNIVGQGYSVSINVTVENHGNFTEAFNVTAYYGNGTVTSEQWETFWSMGDVNRDGYINNVDVSLMNTALESRPGDPNWDPRCDLNQDEAVDYSDTIILAVGYGLDVWDYFISGGVIGTQTTSNLLKGTSANLTLTWNTTSVARGNFTISAHITPVLGETDTTDNNFADDTVYVGFPGDLNGDREVDIFDAIILSRAFGSTLNDHRWNPNADINGDGTVDIFDAIILAGNFGQID